MSTTANNQGISANGWIQTFPVGVQAQNYPAWTNLAEKTMPCQAGAVAVTNLSGISVRLTLEQETTAGEPTATSRTITVPPFRYQAYPTEPYQKVRVDASGQATEPATIRIAGYEDIPPADINLGNPAIASDIWYEGLIPTGQGVNLASPWGGSVIISAADQTGPLYLKLGVGFAVQVTASGAAGQGSLITEGNAKGTVVLSDTNSPDDWVIRLGQDSRITGTYSLNYAALILGTAASCETASGTTLSISNSLATLRAGGTFNVETSGTITNSSVEIAGTLSFNAGSSGNTTLFANASVRIGGTANLTWGVHGQLDIAHEASFSSATSLRGKIVLEAGASANIAQYPGTTTEVYWYGEMILEAEASCSVLNNAGQLEGRVHLAPTAGADIILESSGIYAYVDLDIGTGASCDLYPGNGNTVVRVPAMGSASLGNGTTPFTGNFVDESYHNFSGSGTITGNVSIPEISYSGTWITNVTAISGTVTATLAANDPITGASWTVATQTTSGTGALVSPVTGLTPNMTVTTAVGTGTVTLATAIQAYLPGK